MSCLSVYHEDALVGETHQGDSDDFSSPLSVLEHLYKKATEKKYWWYKCILKNDSHVDILRNPIGSIWEMSSDFE